MPTNDSWDWPFLMYTATVLFRRTEREFWRMTPKKLNALSRIYIRLNDKGEGQKDQKQGYIDQVI